MDGTPLEGTLERVRVPLPGTAVRGRRPAEHGGVVSYETLTREQLIAILRRRDAQAHYGLVWERKDIRQDQALNTDFVGLRLDESLSVGAAPWTNMLIEGDNYDALRNLVSTMAGRFQLIYIDPPYNTGRRDFVYNDRFFEATDRFRHSTWLEFMYQRLTLARELLSEDGAIVVSIDDNELFNLGLLMNQVFGESSFIANCIWQKRYSRENRENIGDAHEYLLFYSPNPARFKARRGKISLTPEQAKVYRNPNNDPNGPWRPVPITAQAGNATPDQFYPITAPSGKVFRPTAGRCWGMIETTFNQLRAQGRIYFGKDGNSQPNLIRYLSEVEGVVPWTWWPHEEVGHTDESAKEVLDILPDARFDTAKPLRLMGRVLEICAPEKDALVLDFFAGSGSLGHAVLAMNARDGGQRRFVLVSSREATADEPYKNLARDVCAVRLRRAIEGYDGRTGAHVRGLGGQLAYLRAVRIPMHRMEDSLDDAVAWSYALQLAGHPQCAAAPPLSTSLHAGELVIYCANSKPPTLRLLRERIEAHLGSVRVYTWAPATVADVVEQMGRAVAVVSLPADLQRTFRQGKPVTRTADDSEGNPLSSDLESTP